jgi:hypothetical protein
VGAIFKHLCDTTFLEAVTASEIRAANRETLRTLADAFFHAVTIDNEPLTNNASSAEAIAKQQGIPKQSVVFMKNSWDWFPSKIDTVISNVKQIGNAPILDLEPPSTMPNAAKGEFLDQADTLKDSD